MWSLDRGVLDTRRTDGKMGGDGSATQRQAQDIGQVSSPLNLGSVSVKWAHLKSMISWATGRNK